jgi:hypothetical protein
MLSYSLTKNFDKSREGNSSSAEQPLLLMSAPGTASYNSTQTHHLYPLQAPMAASPLPAALVPVEPSQSSCFGSCSLATINTCSLCSNSMFCSYFKIHFIFPDGSHLIQAHPFYPLQASMTPSPSCLHWCLLGPLIPSPLLIQPLLSTSQNSFKPSNFESEPQYF